MQVGGLSSMNSVSFSSARAHAGYASAGNHANTNNVNSTVFSDTPVFGSVNPNQSLSSVSTTRGTSLPDGLTYQHLSFSMLAKKPEIQSEVASKQQASSSASQFNDARAQAELMAIQEDISALAARDREVRAHEQAHIAAGGPYVGAARYTYQKGPDGVNYAVGGEVPIDVSPAATPEQTLEKARIIRRAALAPAEPSGQDRKVAALAVAMEQQAKLDLQQAKNSESEIHISNKKPAKNDELDKPADVIQANNLEFAEQIQASTPSSEALTPKAPTFESHSQALRMFSSVENIQQKTHSLNFKV